MHLFCFGLGNVAQALINQLDSQWKVSGTHTGKRPLKLNEYIFNIQDKPNPNILDDVTHILISIPPRDDGDPVFNIFGEYIKTLPKLKWLGYFSSTSVYGDHQGEWVNELSETRANDSLGINRLLAENQWLKSDIPLNIFRISGIYGARHSALDMVRSNRASRILKPNHFFSRIHIEDLISIVHLIMNNPTNKQIYNLSDDNPSAQHEVIEFACKLLGVTPPPLVNFLDANLTETMRSYYLSSKKVDNQKIKDVYNYKFKFPSYKDGLLEIYRKENA